jgi:hypothetical protein
MSHVSDGALHAYLDGALDEYPAGEGARIREHLATCDACARRLVDARLIREEASALLAGVAPEVELPPLEELRARAEAMTSAGSRSRALYRLGWAASVVIAVGAGWMLRGGEVVRVVPESSPAVTEAPAPSAQGGAAPTATADLPADLAAEPMAEPMAAPEVVVDAARRRMATEEIQLRTDEPAAAPAFDQVVTDLERHVGVREIGRGAAVAFAAGIDSAAASAAPDEVAVPPEVEEAAAAAPARASESPVRAREAGMSRKAVSAPPRVVSSASEVAADLSGGALRGRRTEPARREAARRNEDPETGSLVVPGLELISISWLEEGVVAGGVRVLQRLPEGDTLELIHLPGSVVPLDLPGVAAKWWTQITVPRGAGWLVLRAPRSEEALRALLARLDSIG